MTVRPYPLEVHRRSIMGQQVRFGFLGRVVDGKRMQTVKRMMPVPAAGEAASTEAA